MPNHPKKQKSFLGVPDTVYPVTIDPTLEVSDNLNGAGAIEDSVIYSGTPNSNYGGFTYLTVGYGDSTYGVGRAVFRLGALNTNEAFLASTADNILSATFHTWDGTGTTGRTVNLYELGSYMWTESGITWNNCPSHVDTIMSSASLPGAAYSTFDITNLVKKWRTGSSAHFGFILINPDETNSANKKVPCSSEYSYTDRRPYVVMTYTLTSTISSTVDNVPEGSTLNLSVASDMAVKSVVWSSSNTSVATVTPSGTLTAIATGIKAGNVIISATVTFNDNSKLTLQKVLYTRILNGVYRIQNKKSNYYLHVEKKAMNNLTNVYQYSESGLSLDPDVSRYFRQMWKVYYLGDGLYSVRPLYKLNMALDVTGNNVDVYNIGTIDNLGSVPNYARWTIGWDLNGYVFKKNGSSDYALQIENESTSLCANAVANPYTIANTSCKWTLVETSAPDAGVLLYNTATGSAVNTSVEYVAPKESRTLSALKLDVAFYSDSSIDQDFYWDSSNTDIATVNSSTGAVTGVSPGQVTITVSKTDYPNLTLSFTLIVTDLKEGEYYIQNKKTGLSVGIEDGTMSAGTSIEQQCFKAKDYQKWIFTHLDQGYYTIRSANSTSAYYLGVEDDSTQTGAYVVLRTGTITDGMKWKIYKTSNGTYKFIPKTGEASGLVLNLNSDIDEESTPNIRLAQMEYENDTNYVDEWVMYAYVDSTFIAIPDSYPHDHDATLDGVLSSLHQIGYTTNLTLEEATIYTCVMAMATGKVVYFRLHGEQEKIILDNSTKNGLTVENIEDLEDEIFSNCQLVVYGSCEVASTDNGSNNIVNATKNKGATTVVGFEQKVNCDSTNTFMEAFFVALSQGKTVNSALSDASKATLEEYGTEDTTQYYDVVGDGTLHFD